MQRLQQIPVQLHWIAQIQLGILIFATKMRFPVLLKQFCESRACCEKQVVETKRKCAGGAHKNTGASKPTFAKASCLICMEAHGNTRDNAKTTDHKQVKTHTNKKYCESLNMLPINWKINAYWRIKKYQGNAHKHLGILKKSKNARRTLVNLSEYLINLETQMRGTTTIITTTRHHRHRHHHHNHHQHHHQHLHHHGPIPF